MHSYMIIAMQLGVLFALIGIIWQCLQMVFGTLEQRKFLVGTITKWFLFLFCMTFYPAMSMGLKNFAIQMGTFVSGGSTNAIAEDFGKYLNTLESALKAEKADLENPTKSPCWACTTKFGYSRKICQLCIHLGNIMYLKYKKTDSYFLKEQV